MVRPLIFIIVVAFSSIVLYHGLFDINEIHVFFTYDYTKYHVIISHSVLTQRSSS